MFSQLWRKKLGSGLIDSYIDEFSQTVSVGDASGAAFIVDYYGNVIANIEGDVSIWGIAHQSLDDGSILLAIGRADNPNNCGSIEIHIDHVEKCSFQCSEPIWDILIKDQKVFASGLAGNLYIFDFDGELLHKEHFEGSLRGITSCANGILIIKDRSGIIHYDSANLTKLQESQLKNVSYNICVTDSGNIITGNYGPSVFVVSEQGLVKAKRAKRDVVSVFGIGELIITGSQAGELEVWSTVDPDTTLYSSSQAAVIWNIAFDDKLGYAFLALGDGNICCLALDSERESLCAIHDFVIQSKSYHDLGILAAISKGVPSSVLIHPLLNLINDNQLSEELAKQICAHLNTRQLSSDSSTVFLLSLLRYQLGDSSRAIEGLQSIDSSHQFYSLSVLLLAKSLVNIGEVRVASQFLAKNITNIGRKEQAAALQILDELEEGIPELSSATSHIYSSSDSNDMSLREDLNTKGDFFAFSGSPLPPNQAVNNDELNYGVINYIKYEYPNYADHAKKILEINTVENILKKLNLSSRDKPWSLDIGCATCRYPLWLSSIGFNAVGYDIDDDAIKICNARAKGNENITIKKKNILDHPAEADRYSLITCMMGTFNHVPKVQQSLFVQWVYDSLQMGGLFVFSSWNNDCPYNTHLHFYNRQEREHIKANTQTISQTESMLQETGFGVDLSCPISYLPDDCYEAWLGELSKAKLISIDDKFREVLGYKNAQMHVFGAVKI